MIPRHSQNCLLSGSGQHCLLQGPQLKAQTRKLSKPPCCAREVKPAYNKYRSQKDIEQDYIKLWREVTVRESSKLEPMTFWTSVCFVPAWIKFEAIPMPMRFLWNYVWVYLATKWHQCHRYLTLQGAKLDSHLTQRGAQPSQPSFERRRVLQRWHGSVDRLEDIRYRFQLLRQGFHTVPDSA